MLSCRRLQRSKRNVDIFIGLATDYVHIQTCPSALNISAMLWAGLKALCFVASACAAVVPELVFQSNLAYRSPSLHPRLKGLEISLDGVHDRVNKERRLRKRSASPVYTGNLTFPYGVASGDPYNNSAIIWTLAQKFDVNGLYGGNTYPPVCLEWQVSASNDFNRSILVNNGLVQTTCVPV